MAAMENSYPVQVEWCIWPQKISEDNEISISIEVERFTVDLGERRGAVDDIAAWIWETRGGKSYQPRLEEFIATHHGMTLEQYTETLVSRG